MYFDSHAHLGEDCFAQDFVHIVENMRTAGVSGMMEIGFDGPSSYHAVELANRYDWIWAAVGSHPDDAAQVDEARIEEYRALCEDPRVKAIGEIGLDYHYEDPPRDVQQRAFRMQMELAQKLSLPVVIHEREAHEDGLRIISDFPDVTGVFHCFSGSYEMAKELIRARLVHRLYRRGDVQKRAQGSRGRGKNSAGSYPDRNRLPLYGTGAIQGPPQRPKPRAVRGKKNRGDSRNLRRRSSCCNGRKCQETVPALSEAR